MRLLRSILLAIGIIGIIIVTELFWFDKFHLVPTRYFDIDEWAYLYWASHAHQGLMPYRDFLWYTTPGFLWFLTPIFSIASGVAPVFVARYAMFIVFVGLAIASAFVFWETRKSWFALAVPAFLVFLPMPSDKFIEIRPDSLAMLFIMIGLWLQFRVMNRVYLSLQKNLHSHFFPLFLIGWFYGLSIVVSQKMIFFVGIALMGFVGWLITLLYDKKITNKTVLHFAAWFFGGGLLIACILLVYLFSIGDWHTVVYCLTTYAFEASSLGRIYSGPFWFYFLRNDVYYGTYGYHLGYVLNIIFWLAGIVFAICRMITAMKWRGKRGVWQELIMTSILLSSIILYVWFWPMKHPQYLIVPAVFIVFYCVDIWLFVWNRVKKLPIHASLFILVWVSFLVILTKGYDMVNKPKRWFGNAGEIEKLQHILREIPITEPIFDLWGITMYYPQPHYAAVLPIGQLESVVSIKMPSVTESLTKTDTKYIYRGNLARFQTLSSEDQFYILTHYTPVWDESLLVRNDLLKQFK